MELCIGNKYNVIVRKHIPGKGIIVEIEDTGGETAFIHLSKISREYVQRTEDYVSVGDSCTANCVAGRQKPVELSLIHLNLKNHHSSVSVPEDSVEVKDENPIPSPPKCIHSRSKDDDFEKMLSKANKVFSDKQETAKNRLSRIRRG